MSEMRKYFARNWHNLFMLAFISKDQPIKWLFSSIQAHFAKYLRSSLRFDNVETHLYNKIILKNANLKRFRSSFVFDRALEFTSLVAEKQQPIKINCVHH